MGWCAACGAGGRPGCWPNCMLTLLISASRERSWDSISCLHTQHTYKEAPSGVALSACEVQVWRPCLCVCACMWCVCMSVTFGMGCAGDWPSSDVSVHKGSPRSADPSPSPMYTCIYRWNIARNKVATTKSQMIQIPLGGMRGLGYTVHSN